MPGFASRVATALTLLAGLCACGSEGAGTTASGALASGIRYATDAEYRREELVASLVNPENGYSRLRLERYTDSGWGRLPEWNPRTTPVVIGGDDPAPDAAGAQWRSLAIESVPWQMDALVALGREAFFNYPVQVTIPIRQATRGLAAARRYGLWEHEGRLGGAVWVELPSGQVQPALACAACHATSEHAAIIAGRNNPDIDLEALAADYYGSVPVAPSLPGRVDVTGDGEDNATSIADLRAIRSQVNLQRAASVKNGLVALAIRTETLIITGLDQVARPPRKLAFALALYLWQLEPQPLVRATPASARGSTVFAEHCARCHQPPHFSGPAVALDVVGTDPTVGTSPERFTGGYRVPSLRGVGDRRRLFANGAVSDINELLDPERAAPGHVFGLSLSSAERADLLSYLGTL